MYNIPNLAKSYKNLDIRRFQRIFESSVFTTNSFHTISNNSDVRRKNRSNQYKEYRFVRGGENDHCSDRLIIELLLHYYERYHELKLKHLISQFSIRS